ncbi:hypothetical protein [Rhizobium sp. FY34]|uniref:hypothetical protein n=1 Tax=Rhizobium sp. FY34 TaxID=2562309 RepID=UPI0010C08EB7|nr:hypothetical protein [Rhizobium sp. FY34]
MTRATNFPADAIEEPAARRCGTCTLCCRLPDIDALDKPANAWCRHCVAQEGCRIYEARPQLCRDFHCHWLSSQRLGRHWEPAVTGMMVYEQGAQVTVLVDPDRADAWRAEPFVGELRQWAAAVEVQGGYVIVFAGDTVTRIRP